MAFRAAAEGFSYTKFWHNGIVLIDETRDACMEAAGVNPKGAFFIDTRACFSAEKDPNEDYKRQSYC